MYVCMYVCMYVYMYVCMYVCVCVCMHSCVQYPINRIAQSASHLPYSMLSRSPSQLHCKALSHAASNARILFVHISTTVYSQILIRTAE